MRRVAGSAAANSAAAAFDRSQFDHAVKVLGVAVKARDLGKVIRDLKAWTLRFRTAKNVVAVEGKPDERVLLFDPEQVRTEGDLREKLKDQPQLLERVTSALLRTEEHQVTVGYRELTAEAVLRRLIPESVSEIPSSFEMIGHVAHLNLRDECLPYKHIIGQVILDKNSAIRTVVNKTGTISNEFRTFPMEVIAGEDDLEVEVREYGALFRFNFAKVYWNSRLQDEHKRLVDRFEAGQVVVDAFCGVGPFAIPAAQRGCVVHASDLNPESYAALVSNLSLNKLSDKVCASNEDARKFIRRTLLEERVTADHFIMNLPATALEFLDAFRGAFPSDLFRSASLAPPAEDRELAEPANKRARHGSGQHPLPWVHCYCFSNAEDARADIIKRAESALGGDLDDASTEVRLVRNVAPNKNMYCLHFTVPSSIAFSNSREAQTDEP